jgi:DNA-binding MarR family transcriptional regulator
MKAPSQGGFLVSKIHRLSGRIFTRLLSGRGIEINSAQGRILFVLWQEDRISMGELARRSGLSKSTLTAMLDRLEAMGHVQRLPAADDRRSVLVARTDKDRELESQYREVSQEMTDLFYLGLRAAEIATFEATLQRILANLTRSE